MPTNAIKPPLSLVGQLLTIADLEYWTEDDSLGDPWLGAPYRWTVTVELYGAQTHGNHTTREPMAYTARDVSVGDWIADVVTGRAVKIINIDLDNSTDLALVCDVEDADRYNIFTDFTQSGSAIPYGDVLIFSVGRDGLPIFGPISFYSQYLNLNPALVGDVLSNFRYRNLLRDTYKVLQPGHTFEIGDSVVLDSNGLYQKALGDKFGAARVLGTVSVVGTPGQDWFAFKPLAPITDKISPPLPGLPGDLIFLDPLEPGKLTATKPSNYANAIYIKINDTAGMGVDRGLTEPLNNFDSSQPPTATDDLQAGYQQGSMWVDLTAKVFYICVDSTPGAAVWSGGSSSAAAGKTVKLTFPFPDLVWDVQHDVGSMDFTYTIWDDFGNQVWPDHIEPVDETLFRVVFTAPLSGKIVVSFV